MKPWMSISLLLLSVLLHETQGIRLVKDTSTDGQHHIHGILQGKGTVDDGTEGTPCSGKHCSGGIRKLNSTPISSTVAKKDQMASKSESHSAHGKAKRNDDNASVDAPSLNEQGQHEPVSHQDIFDLAGMDYSQARRKPPIHN